MMLNPKASGVASVSDPFNEFRPGEARRVAQNEFETDQVGRFGQFLEGISPSNAGLNFIHLFLPHAPFRYYPSGSQYNNGEELDGLESEVWVEPALASQAYQRHLLQVQMADRMIGALLDRLEGVGILDEALVVVTADHGISFEPESSRRPLTAQNGHDVGLVPLFIKAPHQDRGVVDTIPSRTVDVMPTVADHLESSFHGYRMVNPLWEAPDRRARSSWRGATETASCSTMWRKAWPRPQPTLDHCSAKMAAASTCTRSANTTP